MDLSNAEGQAQHVHQHGVGGPGRRSSAQRCACSAADLPGAGDRPVEGQLQAVGVQPEAGEEGGQVGLTRLWRQVAHQHRRRLRPAVRRRRLQEAGDQGSLRGGQDSQCAEGFAVRSCGRPWTRAGRQSPHGAVAYMAAAAGPHSAKPTVMS